MVRGERQEGEREMTTKLKGRGGKKKQKVSETEPVTVGEALRMLGMDERKLAREYAYLVYDKKYRKSGGSMQARLRALEKWERLLESSEGSAVEAVERDFVELIHEVERPDRSEEREKESEAES